MPYVHRDIMGRIESVHRTSATGAVEYLDASDAELRLFLKEEFGAADGATGAAELLPVLREVLSLFLAKGLVKVDELSNEAQAVCSRMLETQAEKSARRFSASGFVEIIDDSAFGSLPGPR
jgi:hypothetical protein